MSILIYLGVLVGAIAGLGMLKHSYDDGIGGRRDAVWKPISDNQLTVIDTLKGVADTNYHTIGIYRGQAELCSGQTLKLSKAALAAEQKKLQQQQANASRIDILAEEIAAKKKESQQLTAVGLTCDKILSIIGADSISLATEQLRDHPPAQSGSDNQSGSTPGTDLHTNPGVLRIR